MLAAAALLVAVALPPPVPGAPPARLHGPVVVAADGVLLPDQRLLAASTAIELRPGDEGPAVATVQRALRIAGLYRGEVDGRYGPRTAAAVVALHKVAGVERDDVWHPEDPQRLARRDHGAILARHLQEPDRVEVDLGRQVLFVVREGEVAAVVPVSTGNGARYWSRNGGPNGGWVRATTPRGDFRLMKHVHGWRRNYLGSLYEPWYITPYYAIHGSRRVPPYPASHGCIRVTTWDAEAIEPLLFLGMPVHVWEE